MKKSSESTVNASTRNTPKESYLVKEVSPNAMNSPTLKTKDSMLPKSSLKTHSLKTEPDKS